MTAAALPTVRAPAQLDNLVAPAIAFAIGLTAWSSDLQALALAPLAVSVWATRPTRTAAWLCMLAYYLAASRGLPFGAARFYGGNTPAVFSFALWAGSALALSAPWAALWGRAGFWWRVPAAVALCAAPPVGLVGWANPAAAAGLYFPGLAWLGLALMLAGLVALAYRPVTAALALGLTAIVLGQVHEPRPSPLWIDQAQTTYGGAGGAGRDFMRDYASNMGAIERAATSKSEAILFPETIAGLWTEQTQDLWADVAQQLRSEGRTAFVGAEIPIAGSQKTRNALVLVGAERGEFRQRIPVPISMWKPWADDGTLANVLGDGIHEYRGRRMATFICYEQLLAWPMLLSMASDPQFMLGAANDYWAADTSIPGIQRTHMRAWAQLFDVPLAMATNL